MVFGSLTVFPLTVVHLDPCVQLHAHVRARNVLFLEKAQISTLRWPFPRSVCFVWGPGWVLMFKSSQRNTLKVRNGSVILAHSTVDPLSTGAA